MARRLRQLLFTHFKELEEKDLQKCRSLLKECVEVPRRWSKKPGYVGLVDTLMREHKDERALEMAVDLLLKVNRKDLSDHLVQESQTYLDQQRHERELQEDQKRKYVDEIKERHRILEKNESVGCDRFLLDEKYTNMVIANERYNPVWGGNDIMHYGSDDQEIMKKLGADSYSKVVDLFEPNIHGHTPRVIVLQGIEGIGKTTTALQIMRDWASGSLFQDRFDFAFLIRCCDIIQIPGQQTTGDLLMQSYVEVFEGAGVPSAEPGRLLFIVDGFDELRCPVVPQADPGSKISAEGVQRELLRKKIFDKSHIIMTCRPTAFKDLSMHVKVHRVAQILGFTKDDRKEYFTKYFESPALGSQVFHIVQDTEILHSLCFVPIVCWMVCTVIKQEMSKGLDFNLPSRRISSVYTSFLTNVLNQQRTNSGHCGARKLKKLCALARDAMHEQRMVFWEEDIIKYGLTISEIQSIFLKSYIFQSIDHSHRTYKFIHLSFQEFLAALSYVLEVDGETAESTQIPHPEAIGLLKKSQTYDHRHLIYTARFVCGLLNAENFSQLEASPDLRISDIVKSEVLLWIQDKLHEAGDVAGTQLLHLMYLLYELEDEEFSINTLGHFQSLDIGGPLTNMDYKILMFLLEKTAVIERFHISSTAVRPEHLECLMPWLLSCSSLRLLSCWAAGPDTTCTTCASCCAKLCSVLSANPSLVHLDLGFNHLDVSGVRYLCEGLKHPSCHVHTLDLRCCLLSEESCADLASVLTTSKSLRELFLTDNALCDPGLNQLCGGLKHPDCRLQKLELWGCKLTSSSCRELAFLLSTNQLLTELDIGNNLLMDSGVTLLCEGLKHPQCKLQKLA